MEIFNRFKGFCKSLDFNFNFKYRHRIFLCFILLAIGVFILLYITGPKGDSGPVIRVLHISYSEGGSTISVLNNEDQKTIIIHRGDWELVSEVQPFYQNNIVLECTASFPIYWGYEGFGIPNAKVDNVRKAENFNDTTTYLFQSLLNVMPISETTTGRYICTGTPTPKYSSVYIFVPGVETILVRSDLSLDSDISEELAIPCPISNPEANVTLISSNTGAVANEYIKSFDPTKGFVLNAKYLEEKDPIGTYYCEDATSKSKSGKIVISPKKDSTVKPYPESTTAVFNPSFNGTFRCQAKENVTLKFRKIQKLRKPSFILNLSSDFPFEVMVQLSKQDLKEGSIISCLTISQGVQLHSWTVSFSKSEEIQNQTPKIFYKEDSDEYVCCGTKSKFKKLDCSTPSECHVRRGCLTSDIGDERCKLEPLRLIEKSGCLHYKVEYNRDNISSGLLHCSNSNDGKFISGIYLNVKMENDSVSSDYSENPLQHLTSLNKTAPLLTMEKLETQGYGVGKEKILRYKCKGSKYYFSRGFVWQTVRFNGVLDYYLGHDYTNGGWTFSELKFQNPLDLKRQAKKIYCIAPIWNSHKDFVFAFKHV